MNTPELLTCQEVLHLTGIRSRTTIWRRIQTGGLVGEVKQLGFRRRGGRLCPVAASGNADRQAGRGRPPDQCPNPRTKAGAGSPQGNTGLEVAGLRDAATAPDGGWKRKRMVAVQTETQDAKRNSSSTAGVGPMMLGPVVGRPRRDHCDGRHRVKVGGR